MNPRFAVVAALILLAFPSYGATRITHEIGGRPTPIAWEPTAFPLRYEIDQRVAKLAPAAAAMVERAFETWTKVEGASVSFQSAGVVADAQSNSQGRIVVSVSDDLLSGQGALAMTSYMFDTKSGRMIDADIQVDPSIFDGGSNAEMALEHEVGHLLGLDHSAVLSSIMYPYVGAVGSPSDLDSDDRMAVSSIYPAGDPLVRGATLQGKVVGDSGGILAAQVVAMNERGQPVGTVLTDGAGEFQISGVPPGRYRLYAEPLDGPVGVDLLQGTWRQARSTPFPTEFFGPPIDVASGRIYGNLLLNTTGVVAINPRVVGVSPPGAAEISLSTTPATVRPGDTFRLTVGGDGFVSGMTEIEVLNPAFRRVSDFSWWQDSVGASFTIDAAAVPGSAVIVVRNGRDTAMLTGALVIHRAPKMRAVRR